LCYLFLDVRLLQQLPRKQRPRKLPSTQAKELVAYYLALTMLLDILVSKIKIESDHFRVACSNLTSKRTIESEIDEIESAPSDRVRENERLLKKKEIEFKRNRAQYSKDS
jgi:hypothetical protein